LSTICSPVRLTRFLPAIREPPSFGHSTSGSHDGGQVSEHCLFGDGSIRFVGDDVDSWDYRQLRLAADNSWTNVPKPGVWQAYSTRAGNDAIQ
jgi:hypothetical protein